MGKTWDMSPRKVGQIRTLLENTELTQADIARKLNISQSAVSKVKKRVEYHGTASPRRRGKCGRKRKTTPHTDRWLLRESQKARRISSRGLKVQLQQQNVNVSSATVRRRLCEGGLGAYRPIRKPLLNARMKRQRLKWAQDFKNWTSEDWKRVSYYN